MKKVSLLILVSLVLLLAFASCDVLPQPVKDLLGVHTHEWTDATCESPKTCECGETEGEALGHTWTEATCTAPKTCSVCQATEGEALGHDYTKANCTDPATCKNCGATTGKAFGHDWEDPTCTDPKTCSVCNAIEGEALGHTPAAPVRENAVAPGCDTDGKYDSVIYCSACKVEISREKDVVDPAVGHKAGTPVKQNEKAPTCTEAGSYDEVTYCTVEGCGAEVSRVTKTVDALGHTKGEAVHENGTEPDCINGGAYEEVYYCTVEGCGAEISREYKTVDALGHSMAPATCITLSTCTVCGHTEGDFADHTPAAEVKENEVAPKCEQTGSYDIVVYCSVEGCGHEISRETKTVDATGHNMVDATCQAPKHCANNCGLEEGTVTNHKLVATYGANVSYACPMCNTTYTMTAGTYSDGTKVDYMSPAGNLSHGYPNDNPAIVDGHYELVLENTVDYKNQQLNGGTAEQNAAGQHQIWVPTSGANGLSGLTAANNAIGVISFDLNLYSDNPDMPFRMQLVDTSSTGGRWSPEWCIKDYVFRICSVTSPDQTEVEVQGWASKKIGTLPIQEDKWTGWINVALVLVLDEENITIHYYINNEYWESMTLPLTTSTKGINSVYFTGSTVSAGTGFKYDNIAFGCVQNAEWTLDTHTHTWIDADCEHAKTCYICGATEGDPLGHTEATKDENFVNPDCVNAGSHEHVTYCSVCNKELKRETVVDAALGHTDGEVKVENNVAPSCIVDGSYDNVTYCSVCGEVAKRETVVVTAPGHTKETVAGKAATCTETGLTDGEKCTVCGETLVAQTVIPATGHTEETITGKAATCTETGLTDGKKCTVCGETLVAQTEIPVVAHTYDDNYDANCNVCGYTRVPDCNHVEETITGKAATCTETGLTDGKKCTVCGETLVAQTIIPATGHTEETVAGKAATCTETGLTDGKKCTVCGTTTVAQTEIPATGHTNDSPIEAVAPNCTDVGYTAGMKCSVCGTITTAPTEIPALGHAFNNYIKDNNATCTKDGTKTSKCDRCDATNSITDEGTMLPHTAGAPVNENVVAPTCSTKGSHDEVVKCADCGFEMSRTTIEDATLPHSFTAATCNTAKTCTVCGATEGTPDANNHKYVKGTEGANITYTCSVCSHVTVLETYYNLTGSAANDFNLKKNGNMSTKVEDGVYYVTNDDDTLNNAAYGGNQYMAFIPAYSVDAKMNGFSCANDASGVLSFRISTNTTTALEVQLLMPRGDANWQGWGKSNLYVFMLRGVNNGQREVYGGIDASTYFTTINVGEDGWSEWVDVQIFIDLDTDGTITLSYFVNGTYFGSYSRNMANPEGKNYIATLDTRCVYVNGYAAGKDVGFKMDDVVFGYTAHKHNLVPSITNGNLHYTCDCGAKFTIADELLNWDGSNGDDSAIKNVPNGNVTVEVVDGQYEVMFKPDTTTPPTFTKGENKNEEQDGWFEYEDIGVPGAQIQMWMPSNNRGENTFTGFSTSENAVGIIAFRMKSSVVRHADRDTMVGFSIGKPRNAADWNDGGSWTDDSINIFSIEEVTASGVVLKGGSNGTGLTLATIPVADGWSDWFDVMMVIDMDADGTMTIYYYINDQLCGFFKRNLNEVGPDGRYLNPQIIEALQISGWTFAANTGIVFDDFYFGCTKNGHNTLDGMFHVIPEGATCAEAVTCTCGWTGIAVDHDITPATCAAPATCKACGMTVGEALPHSNITSSYVGGKAAYTCVDCNNKFSVETEGVYFDGTSADPLGGSNHYVGSDANGTSQYNNGANKYVSNGEYFEAITDKDATVNTYSQMQLWLPGIKGGAGTFTDFSLDNASVGAISFKANINFANKSDMYSFKLVETGWGTTGCIDINVVAFAPKMSGDTVTGYILSGYGTNPDDTYTQQIATFDKGDDGWSGWIDVKVILAMNPTSGNLEAYYYVNGKYVTMGEKKVTTTGESIKSVYINLNAWKTGTGIMIDDIAFGYTLNGMKKVEAAPEAPFYKEVIAAENVTNAALKAINAGKIKQFDQANANADPAANGDYFVEGGTPVYVIADKNGADVEALYFSRSVEWLTGSQNSGWSEFRFNVTGKATKISIDYKVIGTVDSSTEESDDGIGALGTSYVQIKTSAGTYVDLANSSLTIDGEWHTITLELGEGVEITNILVKLYHFQGEMLVANPQVTMAA